MPRVKRLALKLLTVRLGLALSVALSGPAARGVTQARAASSTQPLTVSAVFAGQTLSPEAPLELRLSRPLLPAEGGLAIFIAATDVTDLVEASDPVTLKYHPRPLPLPVGETKVTVYLDSPGQGWKQIAQISFRVAKTQAETLARSRSQAGPQPREQAPATGQPPEAAAGREGFSLMPSLSVSAQSQPAVSFAPASARPGRATFTDLALRGSLRSLAASGPFGLQNQFDVVGSSYRPEALRYSTLGDQAPRIDLAGYLMQFKLGPVGLNAGGISYGSHRHLIDRFTSRGLSLSLPLGKRADVSVAALNGTNIVGWGNFFGLGRRDHQVVSGTIGYEVLADRPGGLRVEASVLTGSLLPESGFNQNLINDAEKSRGAALRVSASDKEQRLQLDAGFSRSLSANPHDPLLDPQRSAVSVRPVTSNAYYLDAGYQILREVPLTGTTKASLQVNYQHERVDPWFRSVPAAVRANKLLNRAGLVAKLGAVTAAYSHARFNDNLDDVPSILKTLTRQHGLMIGVPLATFFGQRGSSSRPPAWLPSLSYSYDRTHQFGAGVPENSDFKEAQVPDQVAANHLLTAEWQTQRWRYSYRLTYTAQDNLGGNRGGAKLRNMVHGLTLGFAPHSGFDVSFDLNVERVLSLDTNLNKDARRADGTLRFGLFANWRPTGRMTVGANLSSTGARSLGDLSLTSSNRNTQFDLQWSWRFMGQAQAEQERAAKFRPKLQGQFHVRGAHRFARSRNELQRLDGFNRTSTLSAGLTFTLF